jgi:hypothetical protein
MSGSLSRNILITMSDENEFISEDENNVRSNLEEEREVATFEQENVDRPQTEESYEMVSVGSEDRMEEDEAAAESHKQRIEEQIEEVRIDNETLNQDKLEGPQSSLEKVPSKKRKARKSTGRSTGTKSKEKPELIKQEDKATETFLTQISERLKLNEQKLDKIMSTIRPIEKHIHSTDKQAQLSKQIQLQIKQLQTQVKQIERMSKNMSIEISRRANKEKSLKAHKKTVERTAPSKSKQSNKARSKKNSKIGKRK